MATAKWNGVVIAESDDVEEVEGNLYFPPQAVNPDYIISSDTTSVCPWKGTASYYNIVIDGDTNVDAAWFYPAPKEAAIQIKGYVAFWRGVDVTP